MIELLLILGRFFIGCIAVGTVLGTLYLMIESCDLKEWLIVVLIGTIVLAILIFLFSLSNNKLLDKQAEADAIDEKIISLSLKNNVTKEEITPYIKYIELANSDENKNTIVVRQPDGVSIDNISDTTLSDVFGLPERKPAIAINIYATSEFDFQSLKKKALQDDILYKVAYLSIDDNLSLKKLMEYSEYITFIDDISAELPIQLTFYEQNDCIFAVASNRQ